MTTRNDIFPDPIGTLIISNSSAGSALRNIAGGTIVTFGELESIDKVLKNYSLIIFVCAVPIAVRFLSRAILDKQTDPAVLCLDEKGKNAVVLLGAHRGGNRAARFLQKTIGVNAVISTASDLNETPALDQLPSHYPIGPVSKVQAIMNQGQRPIIRNRKNIDIPLPFSSHEFSQKELVGESEIELRNAFPPQVNLTSDQETNTNLSLLVPNLILGVGCSSDCTPEELHGLVDEALMELGLDIKAIHKVATVHERRHHPAVMSLGLEVISFSANDLADVEVPNPSQIVQRHMGTPSVCEAAALKAAGNNSSLIQEKKKSPRATVSVAVIREKTGSLSVVGIGPGSPLHRTRAAEIAISNAEMIIGFGKYLDLCSDLFTTSQVLAPYEIGEEILRVDKAISEAQKGNRVALISSGDPGIYAMATLVFERLSLQDIEPASVSISVIPGITAALAASAANGAILGHDHAYISLSDLLTPWETIEASIAAIAKTHLALVFYNPRSKNRRHQIRRAIDILKSERGDNVVVIVAKSVARNNEQSYLTTLGDFNEETVDMETLVIVGNDQSKSLGPYTYTRRGYTS